MTSFDMGVILLIFVFFNSYFMYKAGEKAGKFLGMISITQFFRQKRVLKDKKDILGFENWPLPVQIIYEDPDPDYFEDE
tara:strand:+ start:91 stop:327 length:237 start_codon:yes stop_codon:yes gene_type:complete